jgi:hypothetical protein
LTFGEERRRASNLPNLCDLGEEMKLSRGKLVEERYVAKEIFGGTRSYRHARDDSIERPF